MITIANSVVFFLDSKERTGKYVYKIDQEIQKKKPKWVILTAIGDNIYKAVYAYNALKDKLTYEDVILDRDKYNGKEVSKITIVARVNRY